MTLDFDCGRRVAPAAAEVSASRGGGCREGGDSAQPLEGLAVDVMDFSP